MNHSGRLTMLCHPEFDCASEEMRIDAFPWIVPLKRALSLKLTYTPYLQLLIRLLFPYFWVLEHFSDTVMANNVFHKGWEPSLPNFLIALPLHACNCNMGSLASMFQILTRLWVLQSTNRNYAPLIVLPRHIHASRLYLELCVIQKCVFVFAILYLREVWLHPMLDWLSSHRRRQWWIFWHHCNIKHIKDYQIPLEVSEMKITHYLYPCKRVVTWVWPQM